MSLMTLRATKCQAQSSGFGGAPGIRSEVDRQRKAHADRRQQCQKLRKKSVIARMWGELIVDALYRGVTLVDPFKGGWVVAGKLALQARLEQCVCQGIGNLQGQVGSEARGGCGEDTSDCPDAVLAALEYGLQLPVTDHDAVLQKLAVDSGARRQWRLRIQGEVEAEGTAIAKRPIPFL